MKKRILPLLLALMLCAGLLVIPACAKQSEITWLDIDETPWAYNQEFGWVTIRDQDTYEYRLFDLETGRLVDDYVCVGNFSENLAAVVAEDADGELKRGFIDKSGKIVIPLEYDYAYSFSEGLAAVAEYNGKKLKYGYIDQDGEVSIPFEYDLALPFSDGLAAVAKENNGDWKWGFISKSGKVVVSLKYDNVGTLPDSNLCYVKNGDYYGVFENPYYDDGNFPVLAVTFVAVAVVTAATLIVVLTRRKKLSTKKTICTPEEFSVPEAVTTLETSDGPAPVQPPVSLEDEPNFCSCCGASLAPGMQFCSKCGKPRQG